MKTSRSSTWAAAASAATRRSSPIAGASGGYREVDMQRPSQILDPGLECEAPETRRERLELRLRETVARAHEKAPRALGCVVMPAGVGQTDLQVKVASSLRATGYAGTPSFLRTLLHRGRELNLALSFEVAFATAEMLPDSLRTELEGFGLRVLQGYS